MIKYFIKLCIITKYLVLFLNIFSVQIICWTLGFQTFEAIFINWLENIHFWAMCFYGFYLGNANYIYIYKSNMYHPLKCLKYISCKLLFKASTIWIYSGVIIDIKCFMFVFQSWTTQHTAWSHFVYINIYRAFNFYGLFFIKFVWGWGSQDID